MDPTGGATAVAIISFDHYELDMASQKVKSRRLKIQMRSTS